MAASISSSYTTLQAAALMHAHSVLRRCLHAWHRVAEEHSAELWIAAQMAVAPQQRACRVVLRGWRRHVHEQQVGAQAWFWTPAGVYTDCCLPDIYRNSR
jgi:hypothetical protein